MQGMDDAERFAGFEGDDTIKAGGGNDTITGGDGRDTLDGGDGNDEIHGGTGDDSIIGGNGDDRLFGDEGNDTFKADIGADVYDGGTGIDTVDYTGARAYYSIRTGQVSGVQVDLRTGQGGAGSTYVSIENVIGSNYNDTLTGSDGVNEISGARGDDLIFGGGGRDTLNGGDGDDEIHGGTESDIISGGNGNNRLFGDEGNDTFKAELGADVIDGGTGTDTVDYSGLRMRVSFGPEGTTYSGGVDVDLQTGRGGRGATGDSYVSIENVTGSGGTDNLTGSEDANTLRGLDGDDVISGGGGNDTLKGDIGNDTISGDQGSDTMYGGTGADTFVFKAMAPDSASGDVIKDFEVGTDQLVFNGFTNGHVVMETVDGGTMVWAEADGVRSDQVLLTNVSAADLTSHGDITLA